MYDIRKRFPAEDIIEPDLPICDAHHHIWDWAGMPYLLKDYVADVDPGRGHRVETSVFVECRAFYDADAPAHLQPVGEVREVAALAARARPDGFRPMQAIVGHADLLLGADVRETLEKLVEAGKGRLRSIRHSVAWDASPEVGNSIVNPPPHLLGDARFREGFALLEGFGLAFEAWLYHPQLPDLVALATAFPGTEVVLGHVGGPLGIGPYAGRREEAFVVWRAQIRQLAALPNVTVKLGGLGMTKCGFGFEHRDKPPTSAELAEAWRPYIETCIEAFGPERCMFESNYPADRESCGYSAIWNAFKLIASGASAAEKSALFRDNAHRFYRIA
jgi:predicted TIM-barrel fold metal-dependent hydrolase